MISKLAELFVEITVKGTPAAKKALDEVKANTEATGKAAEKSAKQFDGFFSKMVKGVAQTAAGFATLAASGAGFTGFIAGVSRGTVEGEKFGNALEVAGRIFNDMFAPYVRAATAAVVVLADAWAGLDGGTKAVVAGVLVAGAAVAALGVAAAGASLVLGGLATIGSAIAAGFSIIVGVVMALASPLGLVIGLAVGLGAALVGAAIGGMGGWSKLSSFLSQNWRTVVTGLIDGMAAAARGILAAVSFITVAFAKFFNWVAVNWQKLTGYLSIGLGVVAEKLKLAPEGTADLLAKDFNAQKFAPPIDIKALQGQLDKARDAFKGWTGNLGKDVTQWLHEFGYSFGSLFIAIKKLWGAFDTGPMKMKFDVQLEENQGTYERLLKAFGSQSDGIAIAKEQLEQQKQTVQGVKELKGVFQGIKDLLPAVRQ